MPMRGRGLQPKSLVSLPPVALPWRRRGFATREQGATAALVALLCLTGGCGTKNPTTTPEPSTGPSSQTLPRSDHTQPAPRPAPRQVTVHTRTTFHLNHAPATGRFTSTGPGSLCHSGTIADQPVQPLTNGLVLNETFSCAHGNKAVEIRETIHFQKVAPDGSQASRAFNLSDGMKGSGHGKGVATGCTPLGSNIATSCAHAVGILTGRLNGES